MRKRHHVDELFKKGLSDPDIPFNEGDWEALSRKLHPRKRRASPLFVWIGSGIAAAVIIAAIVLFWRREEPKEDAVASVPPRAETDTPRSDSTPSLGAGQSPAPPVVTIDSRHIPANPSVAQSSLTSETSRSLVAVQTLKPRAYVLLDNKTTIPRDISVARMVVQSDTAPPVIASTERPKTDVPLQGWAFSVMAAPDLSGTRPLSGKLSGNVGLMATYRINNWLSVSAGAIYARKLYQTDFSEYRSTSGWYGQQYYPSLVEADCAVLDIPLNFSVAVARHRRSTWLVAAGVSSYWMLRETYDYTYPPHEYGSPKQLTLHNENRHILGVGNLAVGYRRQISSKVGITVQPFVKVPLTGIGNGNLKLYSSGVAISADIDLSRRLR